MQVSGSSCESRVAEVYTIYAYTYTYINAVEVACIHKDFLPSCISILSFSRVSISWGSLRSSTCTCVVWRVCGVRGRVVGRWRSTSTRLPGGWLTGETTSRDTPPLDRLVGGVATIRVCITASQHWGTGNQHWWRAVSQKQGGLGVKLCSILSVYMLHV